MHPLLICSIITQHLIRSCHDELQTSAARVSELTQLTGQHEYSSIPFSNPLDLDFISTTRSLSFANKRVAEEAYMVKALLRSLDKIQVLDKEIETMQHHLENSPGFSTVDHSVRDVSIAFNDAIEYQIEFCQDLLNTAAYVEKRISTLIQVVYQFMNQKDAKTNIALVGSSAAIAKAAKADSSAMKTIAILGMFFLPGAFIAAIFAMPVIDWDENGRPTMKPAFKYYWAITAPLTLSVFLSWGLAMLLLWHRWIPKFSGTRNKPTNGDIDLASR
ncbi:hypothetical protein IFR05_012459 [Cadophora sp. M221]|nr:hypothetical protein IFR05_012459 [Cadophora sp. M221]